VVDYLRLGAAGFYIGSFLADETLPFLSFFQLSRFGFGFGLLRSRSSPSGPGIMERARPGREESSLVWPLLLASI
jgi:hypothetical protein